MAKINISFNNNTYSIDESSLSSAIAALQSHLSTTMNGTGATINLGGTSYSIDSAKLQTATNAFVSHLGTIAGSGSKVVVNGVEYGVDSAKLQSAISEIEAVLSGTGEERLEGDGAEYYTFAPTALTFRSTAPLNELQEIQINGVTVDPSNYTLEEGSTIVTFSIDYLKTLDVGSYEVAVASDSKTVKGDFTVVTPELNSHGFYYNQPYTAYVDYFGTDVAIFIHEDGTAESIARGMSPDSNTYVMEDNTIVATNPTLGVLHFVLSADGTKLYCNELATNFVVGSNAFAADEDYLYTYIDELGGYSVTAIDKTKASYGAIKTGINGIDTVKLADYMFSEVGTDNPNSKIIVAPTIPTSVTIIGQYAFNKCTALESVVIPNSVRIISGEAFSDCDALKRVTFDNGSRLTTIDTRAFHQCRLLESIVIPATVTTIDTQAFQYCDNLNRITFEGTIEQWNTITNYNGWQTYVPATYVQCSDGQATL